MRHYICCLNYLVICGEGDVDALARGDVGARNFLWCGLCPTTSSLSSEGSEPIPASFYKNGAKGLLF